MTPRVVVMTAALLLLCAGAQAQTGDTVRVRPEGQRRAGVAGATQGFRDTNGNGIDDRNERGVTRAGSRKDRFVDTDGDGICDGRAGGIGVKRGKMNGQQGMGGGRAGNGNRYGQGGSH